MTKSSAIILQPRSIQSLSDVCTISQLINDGAGIGPRPLESFVAQLFAIQPCSQRVAYSQSIRIAKDLVKYADLGPHLNLLNLSLHFIDSHGICMHIRL